MTGDRRRDDRALGELTAQVEQLQKEQSKVWEKLDDLPKAMREAISERVVPVEKWIDDNRQAMKDAKRLLTIVERGVGRAVLWLLAGVAAFLAWLWVIHK